MKKYTEMDNELHICRICFDEEPSIDKLIAPCRCSGSSKYVHIGCLQRWRKTTRGAIGETTCMECKTEYIIRKNHDREKIITFKTHQLIKLLYYCPILLSLVIYINEGTDLQFITFLDGGETYPLEKCITYSPKIEPLHNQTICYPINVKGYISQDNDGMVFPFYLSIILSMYSFLLIMGFSLYQIKILKNPQIYFKKFSYCRLFFHLIISLRMFILYYSFRFTGPLTCLTLSYVSLPLEICNITKAYSRYRNKLHEMNDDICHDDTILTWSDNYIEDEGYDMIEINDHITSEDEEDEEEDEEDL